MLQIPVPELSVAEPAKYGLPGALVQTEDAGGSDPDVEAKETIYNGL